MIELYYQIALRSDDSSRLIYGTCQVIHAMAACLCVYDVDVSECVCVCMLVCA